jgi:hypothetical protein
VAEHTKAARRQARRERVTETREEVYRKYQWILALVEEDETGSLRGFFDWLSGEYIKNARLDQPLTVPVTEAQFDRRLNETAWKQQYDSFEAEARIQQADPRLRQDWLRSIEDRGLEIQQVAEQYGVQLSEGELEDLATQSRLQRWDSARIRRALIPMLERTIAEGQDLMGQAGNAETQLLNWTRQNGLQMSRADIAPYLSNITLGRQSLEDAQQDIRRTYLAGMFPAWADKINEGFDPSQIFSPYRNAARNLLELDDIGFDDPIIKRATQRVGADGKPVQMPLYEFEQEVRKDPRWQTTDNAYKTYTDVGTDLLRMFGFR